MAFTGAAGVIPYVRRGEGLTRLNARLRARHDVNSGCSNPVRPTFLLPASWLRITKSLADCERLPRGFLPGSALYSSLSPDERVSRMRLIPSAVVTGRQVSACCR